MVPYHSNPPPLTLATIPALVSKLILLALFRSLWSPFFLSITLFLQSIHTSQSLSGTRLFTNLFIHHILKNMASDVTTFPQFSGLPNEIKLQVIETTNPEDIENLSLSCKTIYSLARKTLEQHKTDKNWQSHLHFEVNWRQQDAKLLEAFHKVRHIATNRRLVRYLKMVFIQSSNRDRYPPTPLPEHSIKDWCHTGVQNNIQRL